MDVKWIARFNCLLAIFLCFSLKTDVALEDRISANQSLLGYQTIVSARGNFVLGFFRPGNSSNSYIGIWYNRLSIQTPVWVANRETPVSYISSSVLRIYGGNLVVFNESSYPIWSTNLPSTNSSSLEAVLGDDGNLVLRDVSNPSQPLWQSFDHPTNTFLPGGKIGLNKKTGKNTRLISWKSSTDPSPGLFSFELDPNGTSHFFILWNMTSRHWTSGVWNEQNKIFENVPEMRLNYIYNYSYVDNENESYFTYSLYNNSMVSRFTMDWSGQIQQTSWLDDYQQWFLFWSEPWEECDVYAYCGPFGSCDNKSRPFCNCLKGFDSKYQNDWNSGAYSGGCTRRNSLQCENPELVKRKDRFFANHYSNLPDNNKIVASGSQKECQSTCMSNCTCTAYTYDNNQCTIWYGDIMNLRQLTEGNSDAKTLYLKLAASEFSSNKTKEGIVIGAVVGSVVVVILVGLLLFVILRRKRTIKHGKTMEGSMMKLEVLVGDVPLLHDTEKRIKDLIDSGDFDEKDEKSIDVHSFDFDCLVAATDDFSDANKLGQGGFGSVYKGRFAGGQEIAIKRLSSVSGQGLEEFKNEVLLIAKLQHRNLVRLLGYCFKGDEKILIYEYLPNKSLDFSLFYGNLNVVLNWKVRFNIILGIARGLLYLHQDSRLRIVHRDLKTSNILLDKELNPKISDFGLAKIVEGKRNEGCTTRVVGTYGYMSPEYALDGLFSVKSDVFSFGVVVLEILSGKKNTAYFKSKDVLSLLGYAWKLWREEKPLELMDENLSESCNAGEFLKCMNVALLCVQDEPVDRPTMSNVVVMLSYETENFPTPKQPAFFARGGFSASTVKKVLMFSSKREEETETYVAANSGGGK